MKKLLKTPLKNKMSLQTTAYLTVCIVVNGKNSQINVLTVTGCNKKSLFEKDKAMVCCI